MNAKLRKLIERAETWPATAQGQLVEAGLAIEAEQSGEYQATAEELEAIDEALDQFTRGEKASAEEIEAALSKYRRG